MGNRRNACSLFYFSHHEVILGVCSSIPGREGQDGMRAVATVVMNRVHVSDGEYLRVGQGNLRNIVFQPGQFDCILTEIGGRPNMQNIYNMRPEPIHYQIADWALSGGVHTPVGVCLWYLNPFGECRSEFPQRTGTFHTRVNNHCFYRPTPYYRLT